MRPNQSLTIGISMSPYGRTYGRYGVEKYARLKEHGYGAVDYNIADTAAPLYALSSEALAEEMKVERQAAGQAGILLSQVHGPWRWPPHFIFRLYVGSRQPASKYSRGCQYNNYERGT